MPKTVVITDPSPVVGRRLAELLAGAGMAVMAVCHDGMTALERIRDLQPDVVTFDLLLPRLGGLHMCQALQRADIHPILIAITVVSTRDRVEAARAAGVSYYVLKPIDEAKLGRIAAGVVGPADQERNDAAGLQ